MCQFFLEFDTSNVSGFFFIIFIWCASDASSLREGEASPKSKISYRNHYWPLSISLSSTEKPPLFLEKLVPFLCVCIGAKFLYLPAE